VTADKKIVLFDGVCNFCNFWVDFAIERDKSDQFRFAPLQSSKAEDLLKNLNMTPARKESVILISGNDVYTKSTAALRICKVLNSPLKILFPLIIIPKFIRDFVYDLIAKYRYNLFGKRESCRVPAEEEKNKFLT
jgi:predicted DCC family thiol-disulfide oxidoreductase YuxK